MLFFYYKVFNPLYFVIRELKAFFFLGAKMPNRMLIIILFFISLYGCGKDDNSMRFGVNESIKLLSKDKVSRINTSIIKSFQDYCAVDGEDLVMNKAIINGTQIFISLALNAGQEGLIKSIRRDESISIITNKTIRNKEQIINSLFMKKNGMFSSIIIYSDEATSTIYALFELNSDSTIISGKYKNNSLLNRISRFSDK